MLARLLRVFDEFQTITLYRYRLKVIFLDLNLGYVRGLSVTHYI